MAGEISLNLKEQELKFLIEKEEAYHRQRDKSSENLDVNMENHENEPDLNPDDSMETDDYEPDLGTDDSMEWAEEEEEEEEGEEEEDDDDDDDDYGKSVRHEPPKEVSLRREQAEEHSDEDPKSDKSQEYNRDVYPEFAQLHGSVRKFPIPGEDFRGNYAGDSNSPEWHIFMTLLAPQGHLFLWEYQGPPSKPRPRHMTRERLVDWINKNFPKERAGKGVPYLDKKHLIPPKSPLSELMETYSEWLKRKFGEDSQRYQRYLLYKSWLHKEPKLDWDRMEVGDHPSDFSIFYSWRQNFSSPDAYHSKLAERLIELPESCLDDGKPRYKFMREVFYLYLSHFKGRTLLKEAVSQHKLDALSNRYRDWLMDSNRGPRFVGKHRAHN